MNPEYSNTVMSVYMTIKCSAFTSNLFKTNIKTFETAELYIIFRIDSTVTNKVTYSIKGYENN